jgi:hypothetical protein
MAQESKEHNEPGNVRVTVSLEGSPDSWSVEVPGSLTFHGLQSSLAHQQSRPDLEEMAVTVEDEDAPAPGDATMSELFHGARRGRVHLHRCGVVAVTVDYNMKTRTRAFPPSTTVHRVFVWAVSKDGFNLEGEAHDLELQQQGAASALQPNTHLGTLATSCQLKLELVPKDRPQG